MKTNWAPPLVFSPGESWKQFEVERNCKWCASNPVDYMLVLLPLTIWAKLSGRRCGCGKDELILHIVSVEELKQFQEYRRSSVTVASNMIVCETMGRFID